MCSHNAVCLRWNFGVLFLVGLVRVQQFARKSVHEKHMSDTFWISTVDEYGVKMVVFCRDWILIDARSLISLTLSFFFRITANKYNIFVL